MRRIVFAQALPMTLVQLRHFLALTDTRSFRRAADAVFLSQPALSRSIKALEDELGRPLFDRVGWRTELSAFGRELLPRARRLVDEADGLADMARRVGVGQAGTLRVGLGSGPGSVLTVPVLSHLATHHPTVRIEVARGGIDLLEMALRERRLDALVIDSRSLDPAPDLAVETISELRGAFLCRQGHPLLQHRGPLPFSELRRYPIASSPLSAEIARLLVERYGPQAHPDECVSLRSDEITPLVRVAEQTDAVLLAIQRAAPELVEMELTPRLDATARFGLVTLAGREPPPLLSMLRELARDLLRDEAPRGAAPRALRSRRR